MYEQPDGSSDESIDREKRHSYSGLFKAQVVSELINRKKSLKELADFYEIHPNQIKNWKSLLLKEASTVLEDKRRVKAEPKKRRCKRLS